MLHLNDQKKELLCNFPGPLKSQGFETVRIQSCGGDIIQVLALYYRRTCDHRNGKKYKVVYAGLRLLEIHDRCTPGLASMVSSWSALLSSFDEVRQALCDHGIALNVKVIRKRTVIMLSILGWYNKQAKFH